MPILPVPEFPDVPALPGVPALARSATAQVAAGINGLLIRAGLGQFALGLSRSVWGIFDSGSLPIAIADSVRSLEYQGDSRISDYPQEQGAFESYNKVQLPYNVRVALTCGGDEQRRANFLSAIEQAKKSTELYSVVTPEIVYNNANIVGVGYRRETRNGATLITAELHIEEIRVSAVAAFANTDVQNPASADTVSQGQVQPGTPSAGMSNLLGPVSVVQGIGSQGVGAV
ncbi:phage baseplate protein [Paraburkholderia saeva]|uniref:phage baseplate protein n=1 Tax=Paraburkholderia saeva TaxID=2777537 RepID=UPI001D240DFD|nr:hypothetical protein [Paraburkholderia saeva]CAG4888001.1 hypothetical protein R52603_00554 [Paraburkholderia saeva]